MQYASGVDMPTGSVLLQLMPISNNKLVPGCCVASKKSLSLWGVLSENMVWEM